MGRVNIAKMSILPKLLYRFKEIFIKTPQEFFHRKKIKNPKICMELQKTTNS